MGELAEFFELLMVLCFGISWPISIIKTLKTKCVSGKSPLFIIFIIMGYIFIITSKLISGDIKYAFYFYWLNLAMTSFDLFLQFYFRNKDKKNQNNKDTE